MNTMTLVTDLYALGLDTKHKYKLFVNHLKSFMKAIKKRKNDYYKYYYKLQRVVCDLDRIYKDLIMGLELEKHDKIDELIITDYIFDNYFHELNRYNSGAVKADKEFLIFI